MEQGDDRSDIMTRSVRAIACNLTLVAEEYGKRNESNIKCNSLDLTLPAD
jgi:hypothetical protein